MSDAGSGSEKPQRKITLETPATAGAFATAAGLDLKQVIDDLRNMGIHARENFVMPNDVLQRLGAKNRIEVQFTRPPRVA